MIRPGDMAGDMAHLQRLQAGWDPDAAFQRVWDDATRETQAELGRDVDGLVARQAEVGARIEAFMRHTAAHHIREEEEAHVRENERRLEELERLKSGQQETISAKKEQLQERMRHIEALEKHLETERALLDLLKRTPGKYAAEAMKGARTFVTAHMGGGV